jgi:3-dehydroquinate synthase
MAKGQILMAADIDVALAGFCMENNIKHVIFICDENTAIHCLPYFKIQKDAIVIPVGEIHKSFETYTYILDRLVELKANRSSLIINLGGGTVTDIGGFAASTYMRGIGFLNVPTTLLGMVDAAIGGKTGIDYKFRKNYIGTFALPERVLIHTPFLKTLVEVELLSGISEIIKAGIVANKDLFEKMEAGGISDDIIIMAANTKQRIVDIDFYDTGIRQLLNFGHTIGHAYESYRLTVNKPELHGFAVAKGMMAEARIACKAGLISKDELVRMIDCIGSRTYQSELTPDELESLRPFLSDDKKNTDGQIMFSLPDGIGNGKVKVAVPLDEIFSAILHDTD